MRISSAVRGCTVNMSPFLIHGSMLEPRALNRIEFPLLKISEESSEKSAPFILLSLMEQNPLLTISVNFLHLTPPD
jgi:hypothetical protein